MARISERAKVLYLIILILFIGGTGLFWFDYIGLIQLKKYVNRFKGEPKLVTVVKGDEPDLVAREEFNKQKQKLKERIEELDKKESLIQEKEKKLKAEQEKLAQKIKGFELEKKKFNLEKKQYSGYKKNVRVLANKMANMPPNDSVKIMVKWQETLIIDVLRQMDADAQAAGRQSITSYLLTLMPKKKASRIMYLMTQI